MAENIKRVIVKEQDLYDTAEAIREKTGTSEGILLRNFPKMIRDIPQEVLPNIEVIDSVQWYKENRDETYPFIPLPSEMEEEEDMLYILYHKNENEDDININLNMVFTDIVEGNIIKYNDTEMISTEYFYDEDIKSGVLFSKSYTKDDEDWNTYNFVLLKMKMIGVSSLDFEDNLRIVEMSIKCLGCVFNPRNVAMYNYIEDLRYFSMWGYQNTGLYFGRQFHLEVIAEFKMKEGYYITILNSQAFDSTIRLVTIPYIDFSKVTTFSSFFSVSGVRYLPLIELNNMSMGTSLLRTMFNLKYLNFKSRNLKGNDLLGAGSPQTFADNAIEFLKADIDSMESISTSSGTLMNTINELMSYDIKLDEIKSLFHIGYINRDKDNLDFMEKWNYEYDKITTAQGAFAYCFNLKKIPNLSYEKMNLTSLQSFMTYTNNIEEMPIIDCTNVTNLSYYAQRSIFKLNDLRLINTYNVTNINYMFNFTFFFNNSTIELNVDSVTSATSFALNFKVFTGYEVNFYLNSENTKNTNLDFKQSSSLISSWTIYERGTFNIYAPNIQPTGIYNGLNYTNARKIVMDLSKVTQLTINGCQAEEIITPPLASLTTLVQQDFSNLNNLKHLPFISAKVRNSSALFSHCNNLEEFYQPNVTFTSLPQSCFAGNYKIKFIDLTNIETTSSYLTLNYIFSECRELKTVIFGDWRSSSGSMADTFRNCHSLKSLVILKFGSTSYSISNIFTTCYRIMGIQDDVYNPKGKQDGFVFVPSDMVDTLKSTTNWSLIASQIRPLEDRYVDRFYENIILFKEQPTDNYNHIVINIREFVEIPNVSFENVDSSLISIENLQVDLEAIEFDVNVNSIGTGATNFSIIVSGTVNQYNPLDVVETREINLELLEGYVPIEYEVVNGSAYGEQYGFELQEDGSYYGKVSSTSVNYVISKINFVANGTQDLVIDYSYLGNTTTSSYLSAYLSNVDETFADNNTVPATYYERINTNKTDKIVYENLPKGEHFIYIKMRKDTGSRNGELTFKVSSKLRGAE